MSCRRGNRLTSGERVRSRRPSARRSSAAPRCWSSDSRFESEVTTMLIRVKRKLRHPDAPQRHENHRRPMTRRELIAQGFMTGGAAVVTTGLFSLFANPRTALAQLAEDLAADAQLLGCGVDRTGSKIPFICIDLAGGANLAGSNVLVGRGGALGQLDVLSTAGYSKLGLPGDQVPGVAETAASETGTSNGLHGDTSLGL